MFCCWIGVAVIAFLMFMYTFNVIGRFSADTQIKGSYEIAQFAMAILTFAAYSFTQTQRRHIQISFLVRKFGEKARYLTFCGGYAVCFVVCMIEFYALWLQFQHALTNPKLTPVLLMPYYPVYCIGALLMLIFGITMIADAIRCAMALAGNKDAKDSINVLLAM